MKRQRTTTTSTVPASRSNASSSGSRKAARSDAPTSSVADSQQRRKISELKDMLGVSDAEARFCLESAGWDVEAAASLYLDEGGGGGGGSGGGGGGGAGFDDEVRAPIPAAYVQLMAGEEDDTMMSVPAPRAVKAPFSGAPTTRNGVDLAKLFAPPKDLLFIGPFEQARLAADREKKLLLVNLQHPSEFSTHLLNRDTWSDAAVKKIVRGSYIFWQQDMKDPEARRLLSLYAKPATEPFIMVLDPHSGEVLLDLAGFVKPDVLASRLREVAHVFPPMPGIQHVTGVGVPTEAVPRPAPRPAPAPPVTTPVKRPAVEDPIFLDSDSDNEQDLVGNDADGPSDDDDHGRAAQPRSKYARVTHMSDEAALEAALAESAREAEAASQAAASQAATSQAAASQAVASQTITTETLEPEPAGRLAVCKARVGVTHAVCAAGPSVTTIQFRMPDGMRATRRFHIGSTVSQLYLYACALLNLPYVAAKPPIDLVKASAAKSLLAARNSSLEAENLLQHSLLVTRQ